MISDSTLTFEHYFLRMTQRSDIGQKDHIGTGTIYIPKEGGKHE